MRRTLVIVAVVLVSAVSPGCASLTPEQSAERGALAAYNRCLVAQLDMNAKTQDACYSQRLRQARAAEALAQASEDERLRAQRDTRPYYTAVRGAIVVPTLDRVVLETVNRSGVLDQRVEHLENIEMVLEDGRWVIDKDCCEYSASTLLDEEGKPIELPPGERERAEEEEARFRCEMAADEEGTECPLHPEAPPHRHEGE